MVKINVNGGVIVLGYFVGILGVRIIGYLVYELRRRGVKYVIGLVCIGGG